MGSTIHAEQHYINMEGVIPNSKVVIFPSTEEGEAWKRQLFLRPGEWIPWVTLTVVSGIVVLAVIIFVLHLNEKVGDFIALTQSGLLITIPACREKTSSKEGGCHIILTLMPFKILLTIPSSLVLMLFFLFFLFFFSCARVIICNARFFRLSVAVA